MRVSFRPYIRTCSSVPEAAVAAVSAPLRYSETHLQTVSRHPPMRFHVEFWLATQSPGITLLMMRNESTWFLFASTSGAIRYTTNRRRYKGNLASVSRMLTGRKACRMILGKLICDRHQLKIYGPDQATTFTATHEGQCRYFPGLSRHILNGFHGLHGPPAHTAQCATGKAFTLKNWRLTGVRKQMPRDYQQDSKDSFR